jgi:hypothetical protein
MHYYHKKRLWMLFLITYLLMVAGVLTKGLPSIAFQGLTILAFGLYYRHWKFIFHPANFLFLGMSVLILLAYFKTYQNYAEPAPYIAQLINESSKRASGAGWTVILTPLKILGEILKITMPWILFGIFFLRKKNRHFAKNPWVVYSLLFVAGNLWLYFLIPGTRDRYLYMFLPFVYLILAFYTYPILQKKERLLKIAVSVFLWVLVSIFCFLSYTYAQPWYLAIVLIGIALFIQFSIQSQRYPILIIAVMTMMMARIAYDFIVFPHRLDHTPEAEAEIIAKNLSSKTTQSLNLYTPIVYEKKNILGWAVDKPEIIRFPYHISYYFFLEEKEVIYASDKIKEGSYYVALKENTPPEGEVLYSFRFEKKDWVLFHCCLSPNEQFE